MEIFSEISARFDDGLSAYEDFGTSPISVEDLLFYRKNLDFFLHLKRNGTIAIPIDGRLNKPYVPFLTYHPIEPPEYSPTSIR